jgi:hypothetical protein
MNNEPNDMIPADPNKKLPAPLDSHLRSLMQDKNLKNFSDQLPSEFLEDASEGLGHLKDTRQLESILRQLNQQVQQHLSHKKIRRRRTSIWDLSWTYWAIIIIFLLSITGYMLIRMYMHR